MYCIFCSVSTSKYILWLCMYVYSAWSYIYTVSCALILCRSPHFPKLCQNLSEMRPKRCDSMKLPSPRWQASGHSPYNWASFFIWMQGIMYSRELLIKSRRMTTWYFTVRGGVRRHPRKQRRFLLRRQRCVGRCSFAFLRCEGICKLSTSLSTHIRAYIVAGVCAAGDAYKLIWIW